MACPGSADVPAPREPPSSADDLGRWWQLDAARAVVVGGLTFFHAALIFEPRSTWYVQSRSSSPAATAFAGFAVIWAMPLLFLVAGFGTWRSLRHRPGSAFVTRRVLRLLPPLVLGTVLLVPIPLWFKFRMDPTVSDPSRFVLARFFDARLDLTAFPFVVQPAPPDGLFEFGHLWFVVLLLAFTLIALPVLAWLRGPDGAGALERLVDAASRPGAALLPALPLAVIGGLLPLERNLAGWNRWSYVVFFLAGVLLAVDPRIRDAARAHVRTAIALLVLTGVVAVVALRPDLRGVEQFTARDAGAVGFRVVYSVCGWLAVLAIVGAIVPTRRGGPPGPAARWVNEAVLPVYVLHQPIVVAVGYVVIGWRLPGALAYLVIACGAFATVLLVHEVAIRRVPYVRQLFGLGASRAPLRD